jgi:endonuclease/exonuclease/phosphatase family metal-dependent hydrolase
MVGSETFPIRKVVVLGQEAMKRLDSLRPAYRRDLIDDRDVMVISLVGNGDPIHLMNVYSDDQHRAIRLIADSIDSLPQMQFMGGDFNCHSRECDDNVPHHRTTPMLLVDTAALLGLEYARPENPGHTYESRADIRVRSVIDLVFITPDTTLSARVRREVNLQGQSDHIPLSATIPLRQSMPGPQTVQR